MLLMIAGVILVLWILGLVAISASGALIHILLVVALVFIVAHFLGLGRSSARAKHDLLIGQGASGGLAATISPW